MQVIVLLLLSSLAFAGKVSPVQCDPVEAEKECYNLLCKPSPQKLIPLDTSDLAKAYKAHPYEFPESFASELERIGKLSENIRTFSRKKLDENQLGTFVNEIVNNPVELLPYMKTFFAGELKCIQVDLKCNLIASDLSQYPEGMKTYYKALYEKSLVFAESATLSIDAKKSLLLKALDEVKTTLSKDEYKAEKKKIKKMKREIDYVLYSMEAKWPSTYKKKIADDLRGHEKDIAAALKIRSEDYMKIDLVGEGRLAYVKRTCQMGTFIQDTINQNGTVEKFNEYRSKIIESFKTKFLPTLSPETAKQLGESIKPDIFVLLENKANIYPAKFSSIHDEGYKEPAGAAQFLNDLVLLDRAEEVKCNTGGKLVPDHFNSQTGKVYISKYVLANTFPDVLTHELGHWLSSQLVQKKMSKHSMKKLTQLRKCISNFYEKDKSNSDYLHKLPDDRFHTEEDFADWFAAKAGIGESGTFCDLKKMIRSEEQGNYLPKEGDSHSNFLFRDLTIRLNRGETIPQSCRNLMDVYPESQPKRCDL